MSRSGRSFLQVAPSSLRLPPTRLSGADPFKLHEQIRRFGDRMDGMPPVLVIRGLDQELMILDGVTRAFRIAKLRPETTIEAEVVADRMVSMKHLPLVKERL